MGTSVKQLEKSGFDRARRAGFNEFRVGCSQCEALVINGIPTHETGCPNRPRFCRSCGAAVEGRRLFCEDCRVVEE